MVATAFLVACGGSTGAGGGGSQAELAATACDAYAKSQLGDKSYQLDEAVLAKSMAPATDGSMSLKSMIVIEPGTANESKQTLECSVRFEAGKPAPDVLKMQFIWQ
ncbi:MAG: hypothetical protein ABI588_03045 [Arenimonas sp.]